MWSSRDQETSRVTCIACDTGVTRSDAREYDKYGDRFDRRNKQFEYLCKSCYREQNHQPRKGLEDFLVRSCAGEVDREGFLKAYTSLVREAFETQRSESKDEK